ncbi:unnamed protein product, partial [Nesidiocoris tenuis]
MAETPEQHSVPCRRMLDRPRPHLHIHVHRLLLVQVLRPLRMRSVRGSLVLGRRYVPRRNRLGAAAKGKKPTAHQRGDRNQRTCEVRM